MFDQVLPFIPDAASSLSFVARFIGDALSFIITAVAFISIGLFFLILTAGAVPFFYDKAQLVVRIVQLLIFNDLPRGL